MYTISVGSAAISAPAICTLFDDEAAREVVQGHGHRLHVRVARHVTAKRKSFQIDVNCQIATTTKPGSESGKMMRA